MGHIVLDKVVVRHAILGDGILLIVCRLAALYTGCEDDNRRTAATPNTRSVSNGFDDDDGESAYLGVALRVWLFCLRVV